MNDALPQHEGEPLDPILYELREGLKCDGGRPCAIKDGLEAIDPATDYCRCGQSTEFLVRRMEVLS